MTPAERRRAVLGIAIRVRQSFPHPGSAGHEADVKDALRFELARRRLRGVSGDELRRALDASERVLARGKGATR